MHSVLAILWCMEKDKEESSDDGDSMTEVSGEYDSLPNDESVDYKVEETLDRFTSGLLENLEDQNQ